MDELDKYIDDLFRQKLSGTTAPAAPSGTEWLKLSKTIQRKNFLRFNPGSFNIYYLAAIVGTTGAAGAIGLPNITHNQPKQIHQTEPVAPITDSITKNDTTFVAKPEMFHQTSCTAIVQRKVCMEESSINTPAVIDSVSPIQVGEPPVQPVTTTSVNLETPKSEINETPAISDTIITTDTIRVKKKGVQFKRKKNTP